jgi:ribosomal protein L3 glutamine methyltransferase
MTSNGQELSALQSVRDFFRYAVSRFNAAGLVYGHGTDNAVDEAAFLVLEGLNLPIDNLDPFLDAQLLPAERERLAELIEARVTTRKPLPYILNKAYIQSVPFYVDERVIVPRSFIGEIMASDMFAGAEGALITEPETVFTVLDLCTGSGCLAVLAAMRFGNAKVTAADLSADALEVAAVNIKTHKLEQRVSLAMGDLFAPLRGRRFDLILANPPYVAEVEVSAFGAEYSAEPIMAHLGGRDGLDLVRRIIAGAPDHLSEDGMLICEFGTGREILETDYPGLPFMWLDTEFSEGEVFALGKADFGGNFSL